MDEAPRLDAVAPGVPRELADLVASTLTKKPSQRPDTVEVADALVALARRADPEERRPYLPRLVRVDGSVDLTPTEGGRPPRSRASWSVVTIADTEALAVPPDLVPTRLQVEEEPRRSKAGLWSPIVVVLVGFVLLALGLKLAGGPEPTMEPIPSAPAETPVATPVGTQPPATPEPVAATPAPALRPTAAPTRTPRPVALEEPPPAPASTPAPVIEDEPISEPTPEPISEPTPEPTAEPTPEPTAAPTPEPTAEPTPEAAPPPPVSF